MDYTNLQVQTPNPARRPSTLRRPGPRTDSRDRSREHDADRDPASKPEAMSPWLDATYDRYTAVGILAASRGTSRAAALNNAPEWAGRLWIEWTGGIGPVGTAHSRGRCDGTVHGVLHTVQRPRPATGSVWSPRRTCRIRSPQSSLVHERVRTKRDRTRLRDRDVRDLAPGRVRGPSRPMHVRSRSNSPSGGKTAASL